MKNSKLFFLFILSLTFFLNTFDTTSSEEELDYALGEVLISLESGIQETDIKPRIKELELEWKEYFENLGVSLIGVQIGDEKLWSEKLAEEPMIRNAHLNRKVEQRGSR